jgi:hypothetical protein
MSDLEGEDMLILQRFTKRPAAASVAGRRERETRPLTAADRRLIKLHSEAFDDGEALLRGWRKVKTVAWREANRERWRLFEPAGR